jgi:hypothetical protein
VAQEDIRPSNSILKKTAYKEEMKTSILITALLLLLAANLFMMYVSPFGLKGMEGFQTMDASGNPMMEMYQDASGMNVPTEEMLKKDMEEAVKKSMDSAMKEKGVVEPNMAEGFSSYALANAGGAKDAYQPMGAFDNVRLSTGNNISSWRYTAPNEPLMGPAFKPGDNELFMFKNNQCKPECCGASFSCGGGCVCTTPEQRDYINGRGGNRNVPDDAV